MNTTVIDGRTIDQWVEWAVGIAANRAHKMGVARDNQLHDIIISAAHLAIVQALDQHDPSRGPFYGIAAIRVRGQIVDDLRTYSRHLRRGQLADPCAEEPPADISIAALLIEEDANMLSYEWGDLLDWTLETLPPLECAIVRLRHEDGLAVEAIAQQLGVDEGTVIDVLDGRARRIIDRATAGTDCHDLLEYLLEEPTTLQMMIRWPEPAAAEVA